MASIQRTPAGYRAQVYVRGVRDSRLFVTKRDAATWAAQREAEIRAIAGGRGGEVKTLADTLRRFADEVSPTHRGARWEQIRLSALERDLPGGKRMADITPDDFARWRDKRLTQVKPGTVLRELGLLSAVFEVARREWRWIATNPIADISKPPAPASRERLLTLAEIRAVVRALGYRPGKRTSMSDGVALAFLVALRTGMRAGELCGLTWGRIHPGKAVLPMTKNGMRREVPLSAKAQRLIERGRGFDDDLVFGAGVQTLDALFRRARQRAGLDGFTFHDSRHWAATTMARKVDLLALCEIFGWRDPRYARVYYNPRAEDLAKRL